MLDLFRLEAENQAQVLTAGLLALERDPTAADQLEACMRAAHSLKGAARIVGLAPAWRWPTRWRTASSPRSKAAITLGQAQIDLLLQGVDLLMAHRQDAGSGARPVGGRATAGSRRVRCRPGARCSRRDARCGDAGRAQRRSHLPPAMPTPTRAATGADRARRDARQLGPRPARDRREPQPPARPRRRVAGRVALAQAVRRIAAAAEAAAARVRQGARQSARSAAAAGAR